MPVHFSDEAASPHETRGLLFQDLCFGRGWMRYMPPASILIMGALANQGPLNKVDLGAWVRTGCRDGERGWDAEGWDPVKVWTDEEWLQAKKAEEHGPFAFGPDDPSDAAGANAVEIEDRERELARNDVYGQALGIAPVRTMAGVLQFMIACGVVIERTEGEDVIYDLNPGVELPAEVLPLSDEDRAKEDSLRWQDVHEATAQSIIRLFDPDGEDRPERKRTSLTRLARELDSDFESVRAGVLNLLDEGDFTTTIDVENAAPHQVFELVVDWERFAANRISLRFAVRGNDEPDEGVAS
jgi:hypothetical protein